MNGPEHHTMVAMALAALPAAAQTPGGVRRVVPYQGMLQQNGAPAQGSRDITFRLYVDGEVVPIWEQLYTLDLVDGHFAVLLGDNQGNPLPASLFASERVLSAHAGGLPRSGRLRGALGRPGVRRRVSARRPSLRRRR